MSDKRAGERFRLLSSKKNQGLKEKGTQHKVRKLNCQPHDLTNQLSIINLCCFKLRASLTAKLDENQLRELDAIEIAVAEAAILLKKFRRSLMDPSVWNSGEKLATASLGPSQRG
jgi:hypothetical protein